MLFKSTLLNFKHQFRSLNYYSMPSSILFVVKKRFNFILLILIFMLFSIYTLI